MFFSSFFASHKLLEAAVGCFLFGFLFFDGFLFLKFFFVELLGERKE